MLSKPPSRRITAIITLANKPFGYVVYNRETDKQVALTAAEAIALSFRHMVANHEILVASGDAFSLENPENDFYFTNAMHYNNEQLQLELLLLQSAEQLDTIFGDDLPLGIEALKISEHDVNNTEDNLISAMITERFPVSNGLAKELRDIHKDARILFHI